jgi:dynein heavy chain
MEEALRVLTRRSIEAYTAMVDEIAAFSVEIVSTYVANVSYTPPHPPPPTSLKHVPSNSQPVAQDPFFVLDLKIVGGMVNYTTPPEQFALEPIDLFDAALLSVADIPKLDSLLITKLFLGRHGNNMLTSTTIADPQVAARRERMVEQMQHATKPLQTYLRLFDQYVEFLNTDVSEYVRSYEERNFSLAEDQVEINKLLDARAQIEDHIPSEINLGLYVVRCSRVKWELQKKYDSLIRMIMCLIAQKAAETSKNVAIKFAGVHQKLQADPSNIEEVVEMEDLIKEIPRQTAEILQELEDMKAQFDVLDEYAYQMSDEQSNDKWNAYGWPKKIEQTVEKIEAAMLAKRESYQSEQEQEQEDFIKSLDRIEAIVGNFHQHNDVKNLAEIASQARQVFVCSSYVCFNLRCSFSRTLY